MSLPERSRLTCADHLADSAEVPDRKPIWMTREEAVEVLQGRVPPRIVRFIEDTFQTGGRR